MQTEEKPSSFQQMVHMELPSLRRYGRSICGEQKAADLSVLQLMEDLLSEPGVVTKDSDIKADLYSRLQKNIESFAQYSEIPTPKSRQALLLKHVEGFAPEQAAIILDVATSSIKDLCQDAHDAILRHPATKVLIIEDELLISAHLKSIVEDIGYKVVATAMTETEAVAASHKYQPDLILSDVQLADGSSGQNAVEKIKTDNDAPVVFITAYPERLLTGKCPEPAFLISKPFCDKAVMATISQAYFLKDASQRLA